MSGNTTGTAITDGLATYGRIKSIIGLIVGICFGCIMAVIGYELYEHPQKETQKVIGTALDLSTCQVIQDGNRSSHIECNTSVEYTVDDKKYTTNINTKTRYSKGSDVDLNYDPKNPADVVAPENMRPPMLGIGLISCGIFIIFAAGVNVYFAQKSKTYATVSGVGSIMSAF